VSRTQSPIPRYLSMIDLLTYGSAISIVEAAGLKDNNEYTSSLNLCSLMACLLEASVALDSSEYRRDENSVGCKMHNFTEHGHCSYRLYLEFKDRLRLVWGSSKEEKYQCFIEIGARMCDLSLKSGPYHFCVGS
jgi:hypothetical protein